MFTYDRTHKQGSTPPSKRILGTLLAQPGDYEIRFFDDTGEIAEWSDTTVTAGGPGSVSAPITNCPGPGGLLTVDMTAEWRLKGGGGAPTQQGPSLIKISC
jgi:hypothetical protein